jgi:hypothetical protein
MKIKQYIVTYNNPFQLNKCLNSIFDSLSDYELDILEIYVINNHSNFSIDSKFKSKVTVLNNDLRPDFSSGHLSRNWNQAIINGFVDLNNPQCDILITNQDDTEFEKNYILNLIEYHKKYNFIQFGYGDQLITYTPTAIKKIGLWDERFCNIGHQETDYFIRVVKFLKETSSINDVSSHLLRLNTLQNNIIKITKTGNSRGEQYTLDSIKYHIYSLNILLKKWGLKVHPAFLNTTVEDVINYNQELESYFYYPYFEKNIESESLKIQKYNIPL